MDLSSTPAGTLARRWQWLLIALIVAMFAGALLWLRHSNQEDVAPAPVGERMLPAPEQPAVTDAAAPAARQATPATASRKAAPAVRNREARPLASNRMPTYPAAALRSGVQGSVIGCGHGAEDTE